MRTLAIVLLLGLAACGKSEPSAHDKMWEGAMVAKICPDGSRIYHLTNGEYWTGWGWRVENPETVCVWSRI